VSNPASTCSAGNSAGDPNWTGSVSAAGGVKGSTAPVTPNIYGYTLACSDASGTAIAQAELFDGVSPPVATDCGVRDSSGNPLPTTAILAPAATTSTSVAGLCLACNVTQPQNVIDQDPTNYAVMTNTVGVGLLGGETQLSVVNNSAFPAGRTAGLVLGDSSDSLLTLVLLQNVSIDTLLGGVVQETAVANVNNTGVLSPLVQLNLLNLLGNPSAVFVGFTTKLPFDGLRVHNQGLVAALGTLNVYQACVSTH
jgi:hypothetical protein